MKMFLKVIFNKKAFAKDLMATSAVTPEAQDLVYRSCLEFLKRSFSYLSSLNGIFNKFETEQRPYPLGIAVGSEDLQERSRKHKLGIRESLQVSFISLRERVIWLI